jgi:hypothetical protein
MTPEIKVTSGELREGNSIVLSIDFTGDKINCFYKNKRFSAFAEKNIKWDNITQEYYYESDGGVFYESLNSNDLSIRELVVGRLFCKFSYTNLQGVTFEVKKVFQVLPNYNIIISEDIVKDSTQTIYNEHYLDNVVTSFAFSHDSSTISTSGNEASKHMSISGYFTLTTTINWTSAKYSNGQSIVWNSSPADKLTTTNLGYFGGGIISNNSLNEVVVSKYLVKENLSEHINLSIDFGKSIDNTLDAPLRGFFYDKGTYNYTFEGSNRIETVELDYGDGSKEILNEVNFSKVKIYKKSGDYTIKYTVNTIHELPEITYRQNVFIVKQITVDPFFGSFFKNLFISDLYKSKGFDDICTAWGYQMDRLYNETQALLTSLDVDTIDNKFLSHFAATYGDFEEIYKKIGFSSFTKDLIGDAKFDYLADYDFFDRFKFGDLTSSEKEEFVWYIKNSKKRLTTKGTPASLEDIVSNFCLVATVKELWTRFNNNQENKYLVDEIFDGNYSETNTGITCNNVSMPMVDNENNFILNSRENSYIEINTRDNVNVAYYTDSSEVVSIDGKQYLKINPA